MKRIIRDRHLTPEEAEKYNAIRRKIEQEKSEINARIREQLTKREASESGASGGATLGQQVRAAREALGRSQVEVAGEIGISPEDLARIEQDQSEPVLSVAARLARTLNLSLDELAAHTT